MRCSGNHRSRNRGKHTHLDGLKFVLKATLLCCRYFLSRFSDELFRSEESDQPIPSLLSARPRRHRA